MRMLKDVPFMLRWTAVEATFFLPTIEWHSIPMNPKRLQLQIINSRRNTDRKEIQSLSTDRTYFNGL